MLKLRTFLLTCSCLSLLGSVYTFSYYDTNGFNEAEKCTIDGNIEGRYILSLFCESSRVRSDNSTNSYKVCCETKPEDFVEPDYGRVAKQGVTLRYMKNLEWKNFGLVFGGKDAKPREYTFMAALGYGTIDNIKFHCGGSLISEKHVLTAAHCLFSQQDGPVKYILLGDLDHKNTTDDAQPQYLWVQNVTVHPEYKRPSSYHDIAILHLNKPAIFTPWVQPACLDFKQLPVDAKTHFFATGWGFIDTAGNKPTHLQEVDLVESKLEKCQQFFPSNRKLRLGLQHTQMCAGGENERKDTCNGDSGGPLSRRNRHIIYEQYKGYIVAGITSFGKLCGFTNTPGVYTRVSEYVPWIESVVWPEAVAAFTEKTDLSNKPIHPNFDSNIQFTEKHSESNTGSTMSPQYHQPNGKPVLPMELPNYGSSSGSSEMSRPNVYTTRKPINLIDVHYFV